MFNQTHLSNQLKQEFIADKEFFVYLVTYNSIPQPPSLISPLSFPLSFGYITKQVLRQLYANKIFNFRQLQIELIG